MTSPYTWNSLNALYAKAAEAQANANHFESLFRKGDRSGGVMYSRQKWADLARNLHRSEISFGQKWKEAGRPGAAEAVAARYTTPEAVAAKLGVFDPQGGVDALAAKRTLDQNLINLTNQQNMLEQQYGTSKRDFEQKIPELARQLLSGYSGRGMAYSSGYGTAVGEQQADIARGLSGLDLQRQQQLSDITSQRGLANTGYQNDLAMGMVGTVNRLSARAGTLGYQPKGRDIYNDPTLLTALAKKLLAK